VKTQKLEGLLSLAVRVSLFLTFLVGVVGSSGVSATFGLVINVTTVKDTLDAAGGDCSSMTAANVLSTGDGLVSLREAICVVNNSASADTINLGGETYNLTRTGYDDTNIRGDLDIRASGGHLTIQGVNSKLTVINGIGGPVLGTDRVFDIDPTQEGGFQVDMNFLTIKNGYGYSEGGGIRNQGATLNLDTCTISENTVSVGNEGGGGGIYNGENGTLDIQRSTISSNLAKSTAPDGVVSGGGISNFGALIVSSSTVSSNDVTTGAGPDHQADGGGIYSGSGSLVVNGSTIGTNESERGGGIYVDDGATASIDNSTIDGNLAAKYGAGIYLADGDLTVEQSTISHNESSERGGGLYTEAGQATLNGTTLLENDATLMGGAIYMDGGEVVIERFSDLTGNTSVQGGGIYNKSNSPTALVISQTDFDYNKASGSGGGLVNEGSTAIIRESDMQFNRASSSCGAIYNFGYGELKYISGTFWMNHAGTNGGAICSDTSTTVISNSLVTNNDAGNSGGGIYSDASYLTIVESEFDRNEVETGRGGGVYTTLGTTTIQTSSFTNNQAPSGGGIFVTEGTVTIEGSTLAENFAKKMTTLGVLLSPEPSAFPKQGGGIFHDSGDLTLINSTISTNQAEDDGGGIFARSGTLDIAFTTLTGNTADALSSGGDGGGVYIDTTSVVNLKNSIIASNTDKSGGANDCSGTLTTYGNNLVEDVAGCTIGGTGTNITGVDPLLGALMDNGGSTQTHALILNSPAIDKVSDCSDLDLIAIDVDQRGLIRPEGAACDLGAFEAVVYGIYLPVVERK
jgi:fibronectin-binding autotransporter adhesin